MGNETSNQDEEVRKSRVLFGSNPEPRKLRLETNSTQISPDELSEHRESCSNETGPSRESELPYTLIHTAAGLGIAAIGAVCLFLLWPAYNRSGVAIPGATVMFFLGGIIALIGGPIYALYRICNFFVGPGLSTPTQVIGTFVESLDGHNLARVWNCLTPRARESFEALEYLKKYLKRTHEMIAKETRKALGKNWKVDDSIADTYRVSLFHSLKHDNVHLTTISEDACIVDFDLVVEQRRSVDKKRITGDYRNDFDIDDGQVVLPQSNGLVRFGNDWLLTSGMINTPWENENSSHNIVGRQKTTCHIGDKENRVRKYVGEVKGDKCRICDKKIDESEMAYVVDGKLLCIECERKLSESEDKATQKEFLNTSIGIETLGQTFTPILERGSTLPCEKTEVFTTATDNQQSLEIHVLQGDAKTVSDPSMRNVGQFTLKGIPPGQAGEPQIEVAFAMTSEGQFQLRAKDLTTGHTIEVAGE